ncbi:MAG TPA: flagellar export chaperone FlgN [Spirochaetales bacterium]|nr:flagellar export chaperone FlgN [Spirochaetales bacterium]HPB65506.1 flagellar export chaperone FlgN [Spirochaetales bacterium]HPG85220.1 flagellar export chaperone FlgN [Spirochaetales bacterium]HPM72791.1 flagellar export chaperone FlgN [Spirochaetales bacterium]HQO65682.1 flagellar export chaperone FlgN [Spirochaetales bacterium]
MPPDGKLSRQELDERVAVLKRFRELLVRQRDKFNEYMSLLERQRTDIESGDVDALVAHVELEQGIVSEIFAVQKVIEPLEDMYRSAYRGAEPEGVAELRSTLSELKDEVVVRNSENRALLKQRMDMLRHEIMSVGNPYAKRKSVYGSAAEPRALDIRG